MPHTVVFKFLRQLSEGLNPKKNEGRFQEARVLIGFDSQRTGFTRSKEGKTVASATINRGKDRQMKPTWKMLGAKERQVFVNLIKFSVIEE